MTTQTFSPKSGRTDRKFGKVWQAVRYETGYSAYKMGIGDPNYSDEFYVLGRRDAIIERVSKKPNFVPSMTRQHCEPIDRDWSGVLIVGICVAFVLAAWLFAMNADFRG
jgi:hypothetical protein